MNHGFVYIWYDRLKEMFYIGSHMGSEDSGYICSSKWMIRAYKRRPLDFRRKILGYIQENNLKALRLLEARWLSLIRQSDLGKRYYNQSTNSWAGETKETRVVSDEVIRKNGLAFKGRNHSVESKEKIRLSGLGREHKVESKLKIGQALRGKRKTVEHRASLSAAALGRPPTKGFSGKKHSLESRARTSATVRKIIPINLVCENCKIPYSSQQKWSKFCSKLCGNRFRRGLKNA